MRGVGFPDQKLSRSVFRARDDSPDSVIISHDPNLSSVFSSASGSGDRCSLGSDAHDDDLRYLASEFSRLAGRGQQSQFSDGSDLDSHRVSVHKKSSRPIKNRDQANAEEDEEVEDPVRHSFSVALKECQTGGLRSEAFPNKHERQRKSSLDLKSQGSDPTIISSPRLTAMKKANSSSRGSGTFLSHGASNYTHATGSGMGSQKGWSSERVPMPTNCTHRYANAFPFPFNNGRALPSKWEDAERWILSPGAGEGINRSMMPQPQRKPKSKSGPLGTPGMASYSSSFSPSTLAVFGGMKIGNFMGSPLFSVDDVSSGRPSCGSGGDNGVRGESYPTQTEPSVVRSASVHGWSDHLIQSLPSSGDEKVDGRKDEGTMVSPAFSRRDMATQMSPEGSTCSSPKERPSLSPPSVLPITELQGHRSSDVEIKDVEVDDCVTVTRWSKKQGARRFNKGTSIIRSWRKKSSERQAPAWEAAETAICVSKFRREEAKITAWENLQKAKAEAEIRKLEMKLEKIRTSAMDKIMKKLRSAQRKAQEMRSSVSTSQEYETYSTTDRAPSFHKSSQMSSLGGCFTCPAF